MAFKEKLARLAEISKERSVKLRDDKKVWIQEVRNLYDDIERWFDEYTDEGYMTIEYLQLDDAEYEDFLSETNIMELNIGNGPSVVLKPFGINIIGAFGKIDMYFRGHRDEEVLLLLIENADEQFHWELWKNRKQKENILFNKDSFEKILDTWLEKWTEV